MCDSWNNVMQIRPLCCMLCWFLCFVACSVDSSADLILDHVMQHGPLCGFLHILISFLCNLRKLLRRHLCLTGFPYLTFLFCGFVHFFIWFKLNLWFCLQTRLLVFIMQIRLHIWFHAAWSALWIRPHVDVFLVVSPLQGLWCSFSVFSEPGCLPKVQNDSILFQRRQSMWLWQVTRHGRGQGTWSCSPPPTVLAHHHWALILSHKVFHQGQERGRKLSNAWHFLCSEPSTKIWRHIRSKMAEKLVFVRHESEVSQGFGFS